MIEVLWGKNTDKEGTTQEGRQRSGVFIADVIAVPIGWQKESGPLMRLCMGVLGSGENWVKKFREQGAWLLKGQGAGSKTKLFREQGGLGILSIDVA